MINNSYHLYELPQEILGEIFCHLTSKTRAELCLVDRKFHEISIEVSMKLSKYPSVYITKQITDGMVFDINPDYHLIVRLKNSRLVNLKYVCYGGDIDIVKLMISNGAKEFDRGLYIACICNYLNIASLMISHGASVVLITNYIDEDDMNEKLWQLLNTHKV